MAEKRVFTIQKYDRLESPRSECHQVCFTVKNDGSFELLIVYYYNDWGDRVEKSTLYRGKFEEDGNRIVCQALNKRIVDRFWDHEWQKGYNKRKNKKSVERFIFEKQYDKVVCPVDYENFEGKMMSQDVEPQANVF